MKEASHMFDAKLLHKLELMNILYQAVWADVVNKQLSHMATHYYMASLPTLKFHVANYKILATALKQNEHLKMSDSMLINVDGNRTKGRELACLPANVRFHPGNCL